LDLAASLPLSCTRADQPGNRRREHAPLPPLAPKRFAESKFTLQKYF
jgi:hypothetical protein